jgi:NAD(P)-dependent dehydrogenase (short-subunit alcohol dehydrogenase family)
MLQNLPKTPSFSLAAKKSLVTGAGRGIGFAAAAALSQAGAAVTLVSRSEVELRRACESINAGGGHATYLVLDVTDPEAVCTAIAEHGPFDVLVNSAGMNRPKPLIEVLDEDLDALLNLNVKSAFCVAREVVKGMLNSGISGSIINISSQMGHVGSPGRTVYCASKHALEGMTKALAWELGSRNIRVNTICPTFIETAFTAQMFDVPGFRDWVTGKIALGRVGRLEEIMGAVVFLAGDASTLMTGSALMLDGGWSAA